MYNDKSFKTYYDKIRTRQAFNRETLQMLYQISDHKRKPKKSKVDFRYALMIIALICILSLGGAAVIKNGWIGGMTENKKQTTGSRITQQPIVPYYAFSPNADGETKESVSFVYKHRVYFQMSADDAFSKEILQSENAIRQSHIGTLVGTVTDSEYQSVLNAGIYLYKPVNCEAVLVLKKDNQCALFQFVHYENHASFTMQDIFEVYQLGSAQDITAVQIAQIDITQQDEEQATTIVKTLSDTKSIDVIYSVLKTAKHAEDAEYMAIQAPVYRLRLQLKNSLFIDVYFYPSIDKISASNQMDLSADGRDRLLAMLQ